MMNLVHESLVFSYEDEDQILCCTVLYCIAQILEEVA